jgi:hypothetical protein
MGELKEDEITTAQSTIVSEEGYVSPSSQPFIWTSERPLKIKLTDFGVGSFLAKLANG